MRGIAVEVTAVLMVSSESFLRMPVIEMYNAFQNGPQRSWSVTILGTATHLHMHGNEHFNSYNTRSEYHLREHATFCGQIFFHFK